MMPRPFLSILAPLLTLAPTVLEATQPNIIFIMVDDMGYSDLGCYGGEIDTPELDSLADNGLRFTNFRVTPMCVVTRASILSGMEYEAAGGTSFMQKGLSFGYLLRDAGYHTSITGKVHAFGNMLQGNPNTDYGFDRYFGHKSGATDCFNGDSDWWLDANSFNSFGPTFYATDAITDYAIDFIDDALTQEKPFFQWVNYNAPHSPHQAPEANVRKYLDSDTYLAGWDKLREERFARQKNMGIVAADARLPRRGVEVPDWHLLPSSSPNDELMQKDFEALTMSAYAGMIDRVDENVGRIIAHLRDPDGNGNESDSILDSTLILFCSDNGGSYSGGFVSRSMIPWDRSPGVPKSSTNYGWGMLQNTPFRYYKHSSHEGGIRSSFIAHWPDGISIPAGTILHQNTNLWDLYPTFLDLAGVTYPSGSYTIPGTSSTKNTKPLMGETITPLFTDSNSTAGTDRFISIYGRSRAVVDDDWKLVTHLDSPWELYNLTDDPQESRDLAGVLPTKFAAMLQIWNDHDATHGIKANWNPPVGTTPLFWGDDRLPNGLVSSTPRIRDTGVPLDVQLTLKTSQPITFANSAGKSIRLRRYGSEQVIWSADPTTSHPSEGSTTITFDDFPILEPDTHYYLIWDLGFFKYGNTNIQPVEEDFAAFRFKTGTTMATSIGANSLFPDLIDHALGVTDTSGDQAPEIILDDSTPTAKPVISFRAQRNALDAKLTIEAANDLKNFIPVFELDGGSGVILDPMVSSFHESPYDNTSDFALRIDPTEIDLSRFFLRTRSEWKPNTILPPLAIWTFDQSNDPEPSSMLGTPRTATFGSSTPTMISQAATFSFPTPILAWSGSQLPDAGTDLQLRTPFTASETMEVTRVQYTGYFWSDRPTTDQTTISADLSAWLNETVDNPEIVAGRQTIITGVGGTCMTRFSVTYQVASRVLEAGDTWDLRLRIQDDNANPHTLTEEGFGIDTVAIYGRTTTSAPPAGTTIAHYDFADGSAVSSDTDPLTTASAYTMAYYNSVSPGIAEITNSVNGLALPSMAATTSIDRTTDPPLADALDTVDFDIQTALQQFTVTIPAGTTTSLTEISFDWGFAEAIALVNANGLSPAIELVCDKTGSSMLLSDSFSIPSGVTNLIYSTDGTGGLKTYSVDLSGYPELQNLSDTTVTFILAVDENTNKDNANRRHLIDNVILEGNF